jgi:hypothetical protein
MGLPHFTNVDSHMNKWEVIHKNLYEVDIILPAAIQALHPNATHLLLENTTEINMPKYPSLGKAQQRFKYSTRLFTMMPESTSFEDLTIKLNLNQNEQKQIFNFRMMKDWYDLAWNNEDGSTSYKRNMTGDVIIYQHDKQGEVIRRVTCHNAMIYDFGGVEDLVWEDTAAIMDLTCKFYVDYWEDFYF